MLEHTVHSIPATSVRRRHCGLTATAGTSLELPPVDNLSLSDRPARGEVFTVEQSLATVPLHPPGFPPIASSAVATNTLPAAIGQ
jgi:hypothetical protein